MSPHAKNRSFLMPIQPVCRYYDFGLTFRWVRGDPFIVVKRGYVIEGRRSIVVEESRHPKIIDRPNEEVGADQDTWIATIPANPQEWDVGGALARVVAAWAQRRRDLADWNDRPRVRVTEQRKQG
jgi:hypothetical protein